MLSKNEKLLLGINRELIKIVSDSLLDISAIYLSLSALNELPDHIRENYKIQSELKKDCSQKLRANAQPLETILRQN